ncbi:MAG: lipopolysaccharide kinase InaA family protein [Acidobacteriia bacterium]|nr:lipopolysaccharide kinase InaA family protein [Terriglobia bacterium]
MSAPTPAIVRLAPEWDTSAVREWCTSLEALFRTIRPEAEIYRGRNVIFRSTVEGQEIAVKRFPLVSAGKRLLYRLRSTKAVRAFDHGVRLVGLGVGTPRPLAAVESRHRGWPLASYYCSGYVSAFREARALRSPDTPDRPLLLGLLGEFVGRLHELGVLHRDLTSGNILLVPDPARAEGFEFQVVDINRMRFGRVSVPDGIANLAQLRLNDHGEVLDGYCRVRRLDPTRLRRLYGVRLAMRSFKQATKEATRPLRRRLGF